jgi:hypothetical protein
MSLAMLLPARNISQMGQGALRTDSQCEQPSCCSRAGISTREQSFRSTQQCASQPPQSMGQCRIWRSGPAYCQTITSDHRPIARGGRPICDQLFSPPFPPPTNPARVDQELQSPPSPGLLVSIRLRSADRPIRVSRLRISVKTPEAKSTPSRTVCDISTARTTRKPNALRGVNPETNCTAAFR